MRIFQGRWYLRSRVAGEPRAVQGCACASQWREPTGLPNCEYKATVGRVPHLRSMQISTEQMEQELLRLPASERARLAERLIASLDEDAEVDRAWVEEVRRRDAELDSGAVQSLPLEDSLKGC